MFYTCTHACPCAYPGHGLHLFLECPQFISDLFLKLNTKYISVVTVRIHKTITVPWWQLTSSTFLRSFFIFKFSTAGKKSKWASQCTTVKNRVDKGIQLHMYMYTQQQLLSIQKTPILTNAWSLLFNMQVLRQGEGRGERIEQEDSSMTCHFSALNG